MRESAAPVLKTISGRTREVRASRSVDDGCAIIDFNEMFERSESDSTSLSV